MRPTLYAYVVGYRILSTDACHAAALLELCRCESLPYNAFSYTEDGSVRLCFTLYTARVVEMAAAEWGIPLAVCKTGGTTALLRRLISRPGLVVGAVLGLLLLTAASRVVWDIRITGNETVSDRAIEETLASCGFGVGSSFKGFRADVLENQVLLADDRLAWISINRRGTVAHVEVRETVRTPTAKPDEPADIVAATGGIIERVELSSGNVRVYAGQVVGEGDVLVSGLYNSDREGIRFTRAEAQVYARTVRDIVVSIPLSYEQNVYVTDEDGTLEGVGREKSVIFFGKEIKFSKKTGNEVVFCDTIESEKIISPIDDVGFPLSVRTTWYLPYTVTTKTRTLAEAEELAYLELSRHIAALPGGAEILQKTVTTHRTDDAFMLVCRLTAVEDIGRSRPIEVE